MIGLASSAGSFAFNTASSYVWRNDASTSATPSSATAESKAGPSPSFAHGRRSHNNSSASRTPADEARQRVARPAHRRRESGLPSSAGTSSARPAHGHANGQRSPRSSSGSGRSKGAAGSTSSATASTSTGKTPAGDKSTLEAIKMVDEMNLEEDLYKILGVHRRAKTEEVRRAFLNRSRICHPDKLPDYPPATPAFQRLSYAYETISKPASRRIYDLGGGRSFDAGVAREQPPSMGDETLNGVLKNVFTEFLAGDFEMIRVFVNALNEGNPNLNLGDEAVDNLEGAFRRVREVLLSGQKYLRLIRFELIRLYQIQSDLRALSYFDVIGRLRLTLALTRVTLEIPMVLDRAMREEIVVRQPAGGVGRAPRNANGEGSDSDGSMEEGDGEGGGGESGGVGAGELQRRGLLGPRIKGALVIACKVLEKGEKFGL